MPTPAFPHDHSPQLQRRIDVDGRSLPYDNQIVWATIPTNCGFPSTTVPVARTDTGLPVGVQVLAPPLGEAVMLRVAAALEAAAPPSARGPAPFTSLGGGSAGGA